MNWCVTSQTNLILTPSIQLDFEEAEAFSWQLQCWCHLLLSVYMGKGRLRWCGGVPPHYRQYVHVDIFSCGVGEWRPDQKILEYRKMSGEWLQSYFKHVSIFWFFANIICSVLIDRNKHFARKLLEMALLWFPK